MAQSAEINIVVNTKNAQSKFDDLRSQIANTSKQIELLSTDMNKNSAAIAENEKMLESLNAEYKTLSQSATDLGATFDEVSNGIQPMTTRLGELEDRLYELAAAGQTGSREFNDLTTEAGRLRQTIIQTDLRVDSMAKTMGQKLGGAITAVASGFAIGQGAMGLFGTESEDVEKALLKVQSALAIVQGLTSFKQSIPDIKGFGASIAALIPGFTGTAAAAGGATVATNGFKTALISTGIGAIIVGLGLLIANFDKVSAVVSKASEYVIQAYDYFDKLGTSVKVAVAIFFPFIGVVYGAIKALEYFNVIDNKTERDRAVRHKAFMKRVDDELAKREKEKEKKQLAYDAETNAINREIALLDAQGKSTDELKKKQLQRSVANQKELRNELRINLRILEATNVLGANDEMISETKKAIVEANESILNSENQIKIDAIKNGKEKVNATKADNKSIAEDTNKYIIEKVKLEDDYYQSFLTNQQKEEYAVRDKYFTIIEEAKRKGEDIKILEAAQQKEIDEISKKYTDAELARIKKVEKAKKDQLENIAQQEEEFQTRYENETMSAQDLELRKVDEHYFELLTMAEQYGYDTTVIKEKWEKEKADIDKKYADKELQRQKDKFSKISETFDYWSSKVMNVANGISQMLSANAETRANEVNQTYELEAQKLEQQKNNREISEEEFNAKKRELDQQNAENEKKLKREQFNRDKRFNIAQAGIDTASAIIQAMAQFGPPPSPIGIAAIAAAGVIGGIQIAAISKQQFKAARGGIVPGSPSGVDTVPATLAKGEAVINSTSTSMFPELLSMINQIGGGQSLAPNTTMLTSSGVAANALVFSENKSSQPIKAYVVESEITSAQKRISRIERANKFS